MRSLTITLYKFNELEDKHQAIIMREYYYAPYVGHRLELDEIISLANKPGNNLLTEEYYSMLIAYLNKYRVLIESYFKNFEFYKTIHSYHEDGEYQVDMYATFMFEDEKYDES